ncbi:MAG: hypothetical protein IBX55_00135 [Methyloprofundus sp.]|nr:hypothetical protein [Methyloprofundus sp.]
MSIVGGFAAMAGIDITSATQEEVREAFHQGRRDGYSEGWNARDLDYQNLEYKYQEISSRLDMVRQDLRAYENLYKRCQKRYDLLAKADEATVDAVNNRVEKGDKVLQVVGEMGQSENLTTTWKENHPEDWQDEDTLVLDTDFDSLAGQRNSALEEKNNVE